MPFPNVFLQAEAEIVSSGLDKEYAGIIGVADFNSAAIKLALGEDSPVLKDKLVSFISLT